MGTTKYSYTAAGQLWTEDGPFANDTVTNLYANRLRVELDLQQPAGFWANTFAYDGTRRLHSVTSPAGEFDYLYFDGLASTLVSSLALPNTSYITNLYDEDARLEGVSPEYLHRTKPRPGQFVQNAVVTSNGDMRIFWFRLICSRW